MPGLVPGIHVLYVGAKEDVDGRDKRAYTPVFDGLCPAMTKMAIRINEQISLDESEIEESFVRSSGPGGQNVNKLSTAVQLRFDVRRSPSLPNDVAIRLMRLAGKRMTKDGVLVLVAQNHRTQERNRADAMERLVALIQEAAVRPEKRIATRPTRASREERLKGKKVRSNIKGMRRSKPAWD
jgi:ribosome-associated protein